MELESAKAKLAAAKEKYGREMQVFETSGRSHCQLQFLAPETDDFYEFTAEDHYRLLATKKQDKFLKIRKRQESEEAARRSQITKAIIRVRFPDGHTLETTFLPSETIQSSVDLLIKVVARPDTIPPNKLIKDLSQDFFAAGFIPGAVVYFSYDPPKGDDSAAVNLGPFLQEDVLSLKGLEINNEQPEPIQTAPEPVVAPPPVVQDQKPADKKPLKPKWLKM